jgi:glycerol kinase
VSGNWALDREFEPRMDDETRTRLTRGWSRAVERSLAWIEP